MMPLGPDAPVNTRGFRVLGCFRPSELDPATIEREWAEQVGPIHGGRLSVRVANGHPDQPGNLVWHQDEGVASLLVWATEQPTEIELDDATPWAPAPYEVLWIDNTRIRHRQPSGTDPHSRWFVSVRFSVTQSPSPSQSRSFDARS